MSKILYSKSPLVVNPELAELIGLNEAIVVQQVHYWLENNRKRKRNEHHGRFWTFNSYEGWRENFPFWSVETIKRIFRKLEKQGILIVGNFNKSAYDRTKWYSIDYGRLEGGLWVEMSRESQRESPLGQNDLMVEVNMTRPIPETTREGEISEWAADQLDGLAMMGLAKEVGKSGRGKKWRSIERTVA